MHLYVGNLSRSVTEEDLAWIFSGIGTVVFARLANASEGPDARGYAFVHVADQDGSAAIAGLNGSYLKGMRLIVRPVIDRARQRRVLHACGHPGTVTVLPART